MKKILFKTLSPRTKLSCKKNVSEDACSKRMPTVCRVITYLVYLHCASIALFFSSPASAWVWPASKEVNRQYKVGDYILNKDLLFPTKEAARDYAINNLYCYEGSVIYDCSFCGWLEENQYAAGWELTYSNSAGQWTQECVYKAIPVVIEYEKVCTNSDYPLGLDSNGDGAIDQCHGYLPAANQGQSNCQSAPNVFLGNPVNIGVGSKFQRETDYLGSGPFPLKVERAYNSSNRRWQFLSEIQWDGESDWVAMVRADGKYQVFSGGLDGTWSAEPGVVGVLESIIDGDANITGWRYTTLAQQIEEYDANGQLLAITNAEGVFHSYLRTASDIIVTHSYGTLLTYQLDEFGRISGFITPDNSTFLYTYDAMFQLTGVTYPGELEQDSGGTRIYHYEDVNHPGMLTGITDVNGDRFATWVYDSEGRAISSEHLGGADRVSIDYSDIDNSIDPRVHVTNSLGKQTTYHVTTIHDVRKVTQVEGHPSDNCLAANKNYSYDANGFLASKTDWKGNTTTFVRNAKGQELSRSEAAGTPDERTVITEWHATFNLPAKVTEPGRETIYTYDTNANLLSKQTNDLNGP